MKNVFIFHGTEGYPEENWFPWLKQELEKLDYQVYVPHFPSPPKIPAKISEWFDVLKEYEKYINKDTILIGHSLGGIFNLRLLEKLEYPVKAGIFIPSVLINTMKKQIIITINEMISKPSSCSRVQSQIVENLICNIS